MAHDKEVAFSDEDMRRMQEWTGDVREMVRKWDEACERFYFALYLTFQDAGLVEPYYDPTHLCANEEETWEVFLD